MLAVCGGKGGCGKTTTALSLAGAFVGERRKPIVVDCDRDMPNLHVYAGTADEPGVAALADGDPLASVAHDATRPEGVRVVPALPGCDVDGALRELDALGAHGQGGADAPVVLDCPAGASEDVAVPLRHADRSVIVTTPSGPCVRAATKTAAVARALDAPPVGLVVSRATSVPDGLPETVGIHPNRCVAIPPKRDPAAIPITGPVRRFLGVIGPNA